LYRVQVGVYESRENANQVAQSLLASGFDASIVPFQRDGKTLYRVQALVTRDRAKAEALKRPAGEQGLPSGRGKGAVAAHFSAKCSRTSVRSFVSACFSNWRMRSREGRFVCPGGKSLTSIPRWR
jgi:hypothetical protein